MTSPHREFDRKAVITVQGGGVYGLSLLGQLQAVVDLGVEPVAMAGTSAGAIVSTLYWAGLSPSQIREQFTALAHKKDGLISLVGPFGEGKQRFDFKSFRGWAKRLQSYLDFVRGGLNRSKEEERKERFKRFARLLWNIPCSIWKLFSFLLFEGMTLWRDVLNLNTHVAGRGIFPGSRFEVELDRMMRESQLLRENLEKLPPPLGSPDGRLLTFKDFRLLAEAGCPFFPLFLTATNLTTRRLELFDSTDTDYDNLSVARAVRASAGFPFFFRPVDLQTRDGDNSYVDGGVICNFPAFVFSNQFRQRLAALPDYRAFLMRPWVHIGLQLTTGDRPRLARELEDPGAFLNAMWGLATGQARTDLENRFVEFVSRSVSVEQPFNDTNGPGNVLAIDRIEPRTIEVMFERGKDFALKRLRKRSFILPASEKIELWLKTLIDRVLCVFGQSSNSTLQLRSNVFIPRQTDLVLSYRFNMDTAEDTDRDLQFEYRYGLTGFCFTRRRPLICNLQKFGHLFSTTTDLDPKKRFGFDNIIQQKVRKDRTWLVSVPIFDPTASYSWELAANPTVGVEGQYYTELSSPVDGAVFGVLNIDGVLPYDKLALDPDPEKHRTDPRIAAILDIMTSLSLTLGNIFSDSFARLEE